MRGNEPFGLTTVDGRQPMVAVVIDNAASAMVTMTLIEQFGCLPLGVATGEAILALLQREPDVDLVVIDLALANMDGVAVAQLIRALGTHQFLPIVALADNRSDAATRGRAAGFAGTVMKPFSPRELYTALRGALARTAALRSMR